MTWHVSPAQYNGCKWRGGILKVDVAEPDYSARLATEWQHQAEKDEQEAAAKAAAVEQGGQQHVLARKTGATVRIRRREGLKVGLPGRMFRIYMSTHLSSHELSVNSVRK